MKNITWTSSPDLVKECMFFDALITNQSYIVKRDQKHGNPL